MNLATLAKKANERNKASCEERVQGEGGVKWMTPSWLHHADGMDDLRAPRNAQKGINVVQRPKCVPRSPKLQHISLFLAPKKKASCAHSSSLLWLAADWHEQSRCVLRCLLFAVCPGWYIDANQHRASLYVDDPAGIKTERVCMAICFIFSPMRSETADPSSTPRTRCFGHQPMFPACQLICCASHPCIVRPSNRAAISLPLAKAHVDD